MPGSACPATSSVWRTSRCCGTTASSASPSGTRSSTRRSPPCSSSASGCGSLLLLNRNFRGKAFTRAFILLPFIIPTVLSTFAWKWMFDPTFSVINWTLFQLGLIHARINWLGDPDSGADLGDHRQCLARRAVLRHQPARRAADHQSRTAGGRRDRRRAALAALLARDLAAAPAGDHGGDAVLDHSDLRRFSARLCADRRRSRPTPRSCSPPTPIRSASAPGC